MSALIQPNSRRAFIGQLGLAGAGILFSGPVSGMLANTETDEPLEIWRTFTRHFGGKKIPDPGMESKLLTADEPVPGLIYQAGNPVLFGKEELLAVPVWVSRTGQHHADSFTAIFYTKQGVRIRSFHSLEIKGLNQAKQSIRQLDLKKILDRSQRIKVSIGNTAIRCQIRENNKLLFNQTYSL